MEQYEYKHVRMRYNFLSIFSKKAFNKQLMEMLDKMGNDGWELKSAIHEGIELHIHFIFARVKEEK